MRVSTAGPIGLPSPLHHASRRLARLALAPAHRVQARGRMTPDYLVVGTKRGGSTALASWMSRHPQVAPCRVGKGTHYFDVNFGRGRDWFRSRFERPADPWLTTGEASPYYMFHPHAPQRIADELPDVRLVVVLREPAERAWSQYRREVDTGHESLSFADAVAAEPERLRGEVERMLADPTYESYAHRHHTYRARGHYAQQLTRLHELFGPDRVLVVQSEAMFADPARELSRVWGFIGVDDVHLDGLYPVKESTSGEHAPEVMAELRRWFAPLNDQLYALPGVDFRWQTVDA